MVQQDDMEESHAAFPHNEDLQRSLERFVFILLLMTFLAQKLSINLSLRILAFAKLSI